MNRSIGLNYVGLHTKNRRFRREGGGKVRYIVTRLFFEFPARVLPGFVKFEA